jgi:hypothetical protein
MSVLVSRNTNYIPVSRPTPSYLPKKYPTKSQLSRKTVVPVFAPSVAPVSALPLGAAERVSKTSRQAVEAYNAVEQHKQRDAQRESHYSFLGLSPAPQVGQPVVHTHATDLKSIASDLKTIVNDISVKPRFMAPPQLPVLPIDRRDDIVQINPLSDKITTTNSGTMTDFINSSTSVAGTQTDTLAPVVPNIVNNYYQQQLTNYNQANNYTSNYQQNLYETVNQQVVNNMFNSYTNNNLVNNVLNQSLTNNILNQQQNVDARAVTLNENMLNVFAPTVVDRNQRISTGTGIATITDSSVVIEELPNVEASSSTRTILGGLDRKLIAPRSETRIVRRQRKGKENRVVPYVVPKRR